MPTFSFSTPLRCEPAKLFEFLAQPANAEKVAAPDLHAKYVEGPDRLTLGAKLKVRVKKFGIAQTITNVVTRFEEGVTFTDSQIDGPFKRFDHTHAVEPTADGCVMHDHIEYEPPGFPLGLYLTAARMADELQKTFEYRAGQFRRLLEEPEKMSGTA